MLQKNLPEENSESVLLSGLKLVQQIIDFYIPVEACDAQSSAMYDVIMKILDSKRWIESEKCSGGYPISIGELREIK